MSIGHVTSGVARGEIKEVCMGPPCQSNVPDLKLTMQLDYHRVGKPQWKLPPKLYANLGKYCPIQLPLQISARCRRARNSLMAICGKWLTCTDRIQLWCCLLGARQSIPIDVGGWLGRITAHYAGNFVNELGCCSTDENVL